MKRKKSMLVIAVLGLVLNFGIITQAAGTTNSVTKSSIESVYSPICTTGLSHSASFSVTANSNSGNLLAEAWSSHYVDSGYTLKPNCGLLVSNGQKKDKTTAADIPDAEYGMTTL